MKKDDDKYKALMRKYKDLRAVEGPKANLYLKAAMELHKTGSVSEEVVLGCAYL